MPLEGMEEPEAQNGDTTPQARSGTPPRPGSKTRWVVGGVVLILAAVIGIALGASLGSRQGGPLSAQGDAGGRPTIVLASVVASPSASPAAVAAAASPSPVATPASSSVAGSKVYVVQPGDTLRSIAQDQYGDATLWPRIYDANRDVIGPDPDALIAGTKLQIPAQ
jgi:LysM repeat protein